MTCEKCWADAWRRAYNNPTRSQAEHYRDLIEERKDNPCSAKEQAGQWWDEKLQKDSRRIEK